MKSWLLTLVVFTGLFISPTTVSGQETQVFSAPTIDGERLDWCLVWGDQCGQPAADAFCRAQAFDRATEWEPAENIGATMPTIVMTGRVACRHPDCDGFTSITCTPAPAPEPAPAPPAAEAAELEPWTTQDVIDGRIDVQAQYALMRMFRGGDSLEQAVASHILSAIKEGSLGGIYQENQQAPALRAQALGYGWWQILPGASQQPRIDGTCMTDPADLPPILVMRRQTEKNPAAYDAALQDAWFGCDLTPTAPVRSYVTTLPDKEPPPVATECPHPASQSTLIVKILTDEPIPPATVTLLDEGMAVDEQTVDAGGVVQFFPPGADFYVVKALQPAPSGALRGVRSVTILDQCSHSVTVTMHPGAYD